MQALTNLAGSIVAQTPPALAEAAGSTGVTTSLGQVTATSIIFWLPGDEASTWRLVRMPYSTATTPQAIAIKSRSMNIPR